MLTALLNNNLLKLLDTGKGELETLEFAAGVVKDSKILDLVAFSTQLKEKIEAKKWGGKKVAVGLNEENTYTASTQTGPDDKEYLAKVNQAISESAPFPPQDLYITTKIVSKTDDSQTVQIAAVERAFLDNFANALVSAGLKPDYFVPVSLGLAFLGEAKEKPQLLVSGDEKEVFYVFVSEDGLVIFSATYPLIDIVKSTEQVVKYLSEKYPEHPVRKTLVYGSNGVETAKALKQNGLVVEELSLKAKQHPLMELITAFSDAKLIFMPPHLEKQDNSAPKIGGLKSLFGSKKPKEEPEETKEEKEEEKSEPNIAEQFAASSETMPDTPQAVSFEEQRLKEGTAVSEPEIQTEKSPEVEDNKASFLKSSENNIKKYLLLGLGVLTVVGALALALILIKPWEKSEEGAAPEAQPETAQPQVEKEEASPSAKVEESKKELDRAEFSLQVLNGRGTPGLAGATRSELLEFGWGSVEAGNGNERPLSIVQYSKDNKALAEALMKDLASDFEFSEPEPLDSSSPFDAVIIIGDK
ncbi:MAG: LytR C-terminal domain-containing protein [bacterium]